MALILAVLMAAVLFYAQWKYFKSHWQHKLSVQVQFCQRAANAGERCQLREVIYNAKRMPLPALQMKFQTSATFHFDEEENASVSDHYYRTDLFAVKGNQKVTRILEFTPSQRGYYQIRALDVLARDFFLTSHYSSRRENETGLYVYPYKRDVRRLDLLYRQMMGQMLARKRMEEDPFAFRGIREYYPTDSMRHINWKSSAQNGKLLVNIYESSFSREVCILLDGHTRSVMDKRYMQEYGISIASSVAGKFLGMGVPVSLKTDTRDILSGELVCTEKGSNRYHLDSIDRSLARIDLEAGMEPFAELVRETISEKGNNPSYLLITSSYSQDLEEQICIQRRIGAELYLILPCREGDVPPEIDGVFCWET